MKTATLVGLLQLVFAVASTSCWGADNGGSQIELGDLKFSAPDKFERQKPRSEIIAYEFSAPATKGDDQAGRLTIMSAGGSVAQNLDRWYTQFTQPDGSSTKSAARVEKQEIKGRHVHLVDISGTFDDKPAPFAPGVKRENFRMLGAIIEEPQGNLYFKFYGPRQTVTDHADAFRAMIVSGLEKS